jgi:fermentation-respiration switch protein FrsA (DUF1100 family)
VTTPVAGKVVRQAPAQAPIQAQAAGAIAPKAPAMTVTRGAAPAAIAAPLAPAAEIFGEDYSQARLLAAQSEPETAALGNEMHAEMSVGDPGAWASWAKWGGGIGLGFLGVGFFGYMAYAGKVGSHDLMTPEKTTYHLDLAALGVTYEAVSFKSHDGLTLKGWYIPAEVPTDKGIVVFHGHSSNKDTMYNKYGAWLHPKYNLFLYDARYHGESEGAYTTLGYHERRDAQIAIDQLRTHGNTSVGVLGESMGGATAIDAAAVDKGVKAVWSDCPFDSLQDAIAPRAAKRKYPLPSAVGVAVVSAVSLRARVRANEADPIKFVADIAPRPLYLVHGQADDDTTPMNSDKLFEKAKGPKEIWRTEGARHAESVTKYGTEYQQRALKFFDAAL